jgi:hypothetical protein
VTEGQPLPALERESDDSHEKRTRRRNSGNADSDRLNLLETIVVLAISCAIVIFVFAISAAGLGNYRFRLPDFLTDSVKTVWSLATAGGVAVAGSALDAALRRHPRRVSYPKYVLITTGVLFVPIAGLLWFGKPETTRLRPVPGATALDISGETSESKSFELAMMPMPAAVALFVNGEVAVANGRLTGTASGTNTRPPFPFIPAAHTVGTQVALHLCYYKEQPGNSFPTIGYAPAFPQPTNTGKVSVAIPMQDDQVGIPSFEFDIEIPEIADPEAVWLCAFLANNANQTIAAVH